ncbi:MAG: CDP-4-keto-6-deoxy-D-glucose-3-dehydrase [Haloferacaceae archaeon]
MLAIASGKGGCGKTTTTLGLATTLPGPALAVDLDRDAPNLLAMAGVETTAGDRSLTPGPEPGAARPHPTADGVTLVPAPTRDDRPALLERLGGRAEAVLLDCPAGAGPDAAAPLRAATGVLLVSTLCLPALRDAAKTAAMARQLDTPVVGAVLARTRQSPPAVERLLGCPVLGTVPEGRPPVLESRVVRDAYERIVSVLRGKGLL